MLTNTFSPLPFVDWQPTLKTLQTYSQLLGKVRQAFTPPHKHWFHVSLIISAIGPTTTPIPVGSKTFEMTLDLTAHKLIIAVSSGQRWETPLTGQSAAQFRDETLQALQVMGIEPDFDRSLFDDDTPGQYRSTAITHYWQALSQIDALFRKFRGELREETGPVQLWPHHFDLAMLWFSGRQVPGQDPENEGYADEQMNFGFLPGDESIPEPYFYATAYPTPAGLIDTQLPGDSYWLTGDFTGAILPYQSLMHANDPAHTLLSYLRVVQQAGAALMQG
jgi:hypothetical protein